VGTGESAAVTVKVAATLYVPPLLPQVPDEQVKTTLPVYVPVARPLATLVLTDIVSLVPGAVPLEGETVSQVGAEVKVYGMEVAVELVIASVWAPDDPAGL
jgi:hypothetical protein